MAGSGYGGEGIGCDGVPGTVVKIYGMMGFRGCRPGSLSGNLAKHCYPETGQVSISAGRLQSPSMAMEPKSAFHGGFSLTVFICFR